VVSNNNGYDPAAAALEAAVRVLANKLPQVNFRVINLPTAIVQDTSTEQLANELRQLVQD
jgi:hypothetical protein